MSNSRIKQHDKIQHSNDNYSADESSPAKQVLEFQLDCLKLELDLIERAIARLENYSQNAKNFTVAIWAGSVTLVASQPDLRKYIILTAIIPILFWFIDARWLYFTKGCVIRSRKISDFLNSPLLTESFKRHKLVEFSVLDVMGKQYRETPEFKKKAKLSQILQYRTLFILYGGLALVSLLVGVVTLL